MHVQKSAVEMDQDVLGAPLDLGDSGAGEGRPVCRERRPRHPARLKMSSAYHLALQARPNAAHNDFYFGEFGQLVRASFTSNLSGGYINEDLAFFH